MFRASFVLVLGTLISLSGCAGFGLTKTPEGASPGDPASARVVRNSKHAGNTSRNVLVSLPPNSRQRTKRTALTTQSSAPLASTPAAEDTKPPAGVAVDVGEPSPRTYTNENADAVSTSNVVRQMVIDQDQLNFAPVTKRSAPEIPDRPRVYKFGPTNRGDTLADVADQLVPSEGVTIAQMMWALYRKNPESFTNKDINRLKPESLLQVPELDELTAISRVEAEAQITRLHGSVKPRSTWDTDS